MNVLEGWTKYTSSLWTEYRNGDLWICGRSDARPNDRSWYAYRRIDNTSTVLRNKRHAPRAFKTPEAAARAALASRHEQS